MIIKKVLPILIGLLMLLSMGASAATTTNSTSYNASQIGQAASVVKHNVETKYALPSSEIVGKSKVTNSQFLYLLTTATKYVATGNKNTIHLRNVANPKSPYESLRSGTLTKTQYYNIANQIDNYITANGKIPNYVSTPLGNMKYQTLIYMYSNILTYYQGHKYLPKTVSVKSWYAQTLGPAAVINETAILTAHEPVLLGQNKYGKVLKLGPFGTGKNKVAIIVGVHPQEVQSHIAMLNAIAALYKHLKNVQIWVYDVIVYNGANYSTGRAEGQNLANRYVVPSIGTSFKYVIDTHGNRGTTQYTGYPDFVFAPLANTKSVSFAHKLINSKYTNGFKVSYTYRWNQP